MAMAWLHCVLLVACYHLAAGDTLGFDPSVKAVVASKSKLSLGTSCQDSQGSVLSHGDVWSSPDAYGTCNVHVCRREFVYNYVVTYSCPPLEDLDNPDADNCREEFDTAQSFPACCPAVVCDERIPDTAQPPSCYDKGSSVGCSIWASVFGGCVNDGNPYYNFTTAICELTCGFC